MNKIFCYGLRIVGLLVIVLTSPAAHSQGRDIVYTPVIQGKWWNITSQPDLGVYRGEHQEPVDFAVWQAADGRWQLWSCVRGTRIGGNTRLFYRWESSSLQDTAWKPMGIAMQADSTLGETPGGLQAPYVWKENGMYQMVYGDWQHICRATSVDGKKFTRVVTAAGTPAIFSGPLFNTRDPMVLKDAGTYYCYYCGHNEKDNGSKGAQGAVFCRTSKDLITWSKPVVVSKGGEARKKTQWYGGDIECPFVIKIGGKFILFRNQRYGRDNLNTQYISANPLDFGLDSDRFRIGELAIAAPEIIKDHDQYYIVSLQADLNGMRIAKLGFEKVGK